MATQAPHEWGQLIGLGRTAEIYAWGDDRALKLYHAGWSATAAEHEAEINRVVAALGVPAPIVDRVLTLDGRAGVLFERLAGPSLLRQVAARPWMLVRAVHIFTDLHLAMHAPEVAAHNLPAQRELLARRIKDASPVPDRVRTTALRRLEQLPEGHALCHGDYHPDNVLVTPRGPVIVDWVSASRGHPLGDVAQTELLLRIGDPPDARLLRGPLAAARTYVRRAYVHHYLRGHPAHAEELAAWRLPIAIARLAEKIPEEQAPLLRLIQRIEAA